MSLIKKSKNTVFFYDYWLLLITGIILAIGLLLLASASMGVSDQYFHNPFHFLYRQVIYLAGGIVIGSIVIQLPLSFWQRSGGIILLSSILFLCLVLVPGIGREVNGSTRWIGFGALSLQVSEYAKFAMTIYCAGYLVRHGDDVRNSAQGFINPVVLIGLLAILLLMEPDFGATVVIVFTVLSMLYLAGARLWPFSALLLSVATALGAIAIASPYRLLRLTSFLDPWSNPFGSGYQLIQSLIAFGRGGIFGVGLGNGIQKLFYLPEAHTDFLFAVLAEELGIVGQLIVLSLFCLLVWRALFIGKTAERVGNNFAAYLAYGFGLLLGFQVIINIGVNIGVLPTKGLTLPLMSYGGSSMLFNCIIIAVLLRICHEVKIGTTNKSRAYYSSGVTSHEKNISNS